MIIKVIIALAIYDVIKFVLGVLFTVLNKEKMKDEHKIQSEVRTFEERIRKAMEDKESPTN